MSFNIAKIRYIILDGVEGLPILHINRWEDFLGVVEEKSPKTLYNIDIDGRQKFLLVDGGLGFTFPANGFVSLDDVLDASKRGFDGCEKKFALSYSGELYRGTGGREAQGSIFYFIRKLGYNKLSEYEEAYEKGFGQTDADSYRKLTKAGYIKYADYSKAQKMGFDNAELYYSAVKLGCLPRRRTKDTLCSIRSGRSTVSLLSTRHMSLPFSTEAPSTRKRPLARS